MASPRELTRSRLGHAGVVQEPSRFKRAESLVTGGLGHAGLVEPRFQLAPRAVTRREGARRAGERLRTAQLASQEARRLPVESAAYPKLCPNHDGRRKDAPGLAVELDLDLAAFVLA